MSGFASNGLCAAPKCNIFCAEFERALMKLDFHAIYGSAAASLKAGPTDDTKGDEREDLRNADADRIESVWVARGLSGEELFNPKSSWIANEFLCGSPMPIGEP